MTPDSFTSALERLDPASRALLDLSLRRGMRSDEIADVLGAAPENVEASRDEALDRVASDVGMHSDEVRARLAELPKDGWINGNGDVRDADIDAGKRRRVVPLLLALLLIAAVVVIALVSGGGDKSPSSSPTSAPPAPAAAQAAKLRPVGTARGSGTAALDGKQVRVTARGLPPAQYQVWLYNSILDARSLAKANGAHFTAGATLPAGWRHYRFVDVSREPADGNPAHSGLSVLRVPTRTLARR